MSKHLDLKRKSTTQLQEMLAVARMVLSQGFDELLGDGVMELIIHELERRKRRREEIEKSTAGC